jgi:hypothetical protein
MRARRIAGRADSDRRALQPDNARRELQRIGVGARRAAAPLGAISPDAPE